MPELPEVETIRRSLLFLQNRPMTRIWLSKLAPVEKTTPALLKKLLEGESLLALPRRGKYLMLKGSKGSLVIHLGMSGRLLYFPDAKIPHEPHTHLEIFLEKGDSIRFIDPRRFGTLSVTTDETGNDNPFLKKLGLDYCDENLTEELFLAQCRRHQGLSLKALTLNQGIAAGLGNIYACEALYDAGLSPRRTVKRTKNNELVRLFHSSRKVLDLGITHGGSSIRDYMDGLGNEGVMREFLQVYDREGLKTLDGRGMVKRIVQNARSTFFSPEVQK